MTRIRGASV